MPHLHLRAGKMLLVYWAGHLPAGRPQRAGRDHARYAGPLACSSLSCTSGVTDVSWFRGGQRTLAPARAARAGYAARMIPVFPLCRAGRRPLRRAVPWSWVVGVKWSHRSL